ncbi:hypothetical protein [Pontibacter beigongshangensis]|uniref:hypothetical protein n=1 Tax=Pontibacter beigongshangensis TaxID=2574733 RepID=UPI00164F33A1|nr:hypothetical protein [Pontibacter beigongshangensis]
MESVFNLNARSVLKFFLKVLFVIVLLNIAVLALEYYLKTYTNSTITGSHSFKLYVTGMFNLEGEKNVPTYFSTINLLISALLLFTVSRYVKNSNRPLYFRQWRFLGFLFTWLAMDELFQLHELSINPMRSFLQLVLQKENLGFLHFPWYILYVLLMAGVGLYLARFVFSLPRRTFINFVVSGGIFLSGAVGMEMLGGYISSNTDSDILGKLSTTMEETLEMLGIILFIYSLIRHLEDQKSLKNIVVNFALAGKGTPKAVEPARTEVSEVKQAVSV